MSKLSRKRVRAPGPITSTQMTSNQARPTPQDRDELFFQRQLNAAIQESKHLSENLHSQTDASEQSVQRPERQNKPKPMSRKQSYDDKAFLDEDIDSDSDFGGFSTQKSDSSDEEFSVSKSKQKKDKQTNIKRKATKIKTSDSNSKKDLKKGSPHKKLSKAGNENTNPFDDEHETKTAKLSNSGPSNVSNERLSANCLEIGVSPRAGISSLSTANTIEHIKTSSVAGSLSHHRKWNPPAMISAEENSIKNGNVTKSSLSSMNGQVTPRLRVGLSRNYKSSKPLHSNPKWTP